MEELCEKREAHRAPLGTKVTWTVDYEEWHQAESQNVSSSGMMIRTRDELEPGTSLELKFRLPNIKDQTPIVAEAKVVRVVARNRAQIGLGLKFVTFRSHSYVVLEEFVCRIMGLPFDGDLAEHGTGDDEAGFTFEMDTLTAEAEQRKARLQEQRQARAAALERKERVRSLLGFLAKAGLVLGGLFLASRGVGLILDLVARIRGLR